MNIRGIYKTSLIDYPDKICSVLFIGGCNLRCKYCHNPDLVLNYKDHDLYNIDDIVNLLENRKNLIDGVTISGGEPTLDKNLDTLLKKIKDISLDIKIDTNGFNPQIIQNLISNQLIDFISIDVKTSPQKYNELCGINVEFSKIIDTISIVRDSSIDYEIRTTCIPQYVTIDDLHLIKNSIGSVKKYCLQQFVSTTPLIDKSLQDIQPYTIEILNDFLEFIKTFSEKSEIRGI